MNQELKKLFKFLLFVVVIVFAVDFLAGTVMEYLHGRMKGGERARAYYAINQSKADVYVFGSSRALYHYNPLILQDSLGLSVYNAGRSAQTVLYHLPVLKMIMKRQKPKLVILDINENEFVTDPSKYDLLNSLLPYYHKDESVRKMVDLVKPGYRYFSWSRLLPYNSSAVSVVMRSLKSESGPKDIQGYLSVKGQRSYNRDPIDNCTQPVVFDPNIIDAFHEFVKVCKDNNIQLAVFISPRFANYKCERRDLTQLLVELKKSDVDFINFVDEPIYTEHTEYMYDIAHLNHDGSVVYTKQVAHILKERQKK